MGEAIEKPWSRTVATVADALGVDPARGLDPEQVRTRRAAHGPNLLRRHARRSAWLVLAEQLRSLIVLLLVGAAALAFAFGEWLEGVAIAAVIVVNTAVGFVTEIRAVRSMEALRELGRVRATVRRDGAVRQVEASELVPGDVVLLDGGDVVSADLRLAEASKLQANESTLTGEPVPVDKAPAPVAPDAALSERSSVFFKGTAVTRGSGVGIVVGTGMATELGRIAALVETAEHEATPLEKRLDALGRRLVWVTLGVAGAVAAAGLAGGRDLFLVIETAIALAVATVPEGLPIVATVALARGMWRMARRNALVEELSAVETLGSTSVILADKTGTLTENQMTVTRLALDSGEIEVEGRGLETRGDFLRQGARVEPEEDPALSELLRAVALCNNASLGSEAVGDPTEVALLVAARKAGLEREPLVHALPELREVAFDVDTKLMATYHRVDTAGADGPILVAVKGAPEAVLEACTRVHRDAGHAPLDAAARAVWSERNEVLAAAGMRVLAVATKEVADPGAEPYTGLTLLGLLGLHDPPKADVAEALAACRASGIRVVMVTGDHRATAHAIAESVGMLEGATPEEAEPVDARSLPRLDALPEAERARLLRARVIARASPAQKLELIALHQRGGAVVAMTGDGVNDAPALRKADIGVAMGRRGTQVAREAAAMVLQDDAFPTIVAAVAQGRAIFANIRKFVLYLLSCNASEIGVVGLASLAAAPLPILPLQILFLNLVTDVFPALALGVGEGDPSLMKRPPRSPGEGVLARRHWWAVAGYGAAITAAVLGAFAAAFLWLDLGEREAVTISFLTLAAAQLWHVFDMTEPGSPWLRNEVTRNPWVWGALGLCVALLVAAVHVPGLARVLDIEAPEPAGWVLVGVASVTPLVLGQLARAVRRTWVPEAIS